MRRQLLLAIRGLEGSYRFMGRDLTALEVKIALQVLFRYDRPSEDAPTRRCWVIRRLNAPCSVERWRREDGPERELLIILAESMQPPAAQVA